MNMIIISGPSGAGKSTVIRELLKSNPTRYELVRSVTTRKQRSEDDDYTFVSDETFNSVMQEEGFLEINQYNGNSCRYGTPKAEVIRIMSEDRIPILDIDVNGKKQIERIKMLYGFEIVSIFITAPPEVIYQRLLSRGESVEEIIQRLQASYEEIQFGMTYDAFLVNQELNHTLEALHAVLLGKRIETCTAEIGRYSEELKQLLRKIDDLNSVRALIKRVEQFCKIREWDQYNNPKDLAIGISTEANELLDIFRFKTEVQMDYMLSDADYRNHIGEELADIFFFLLRFCSKYDFTLGKILVDKIGKNARKYPVSLVKEINLKRDEYKTEVNNNG